MSKNPFDDFDTQRQCDEVSPNEEEYLVWLTTQNTSWVVYEVNCDDGTHGDLIYEWGGHSDSHF